MMSGVPLALCNLFVEAHLRVCRRRLKHKLLSSELDPESTVTLYLI